MRCMRKRCFLFIHFSRFALPLCLKRIFIRGQISFAAISVPKVSFVLMRFFRLNYMGRCRASEREFADLLCLGLKPKYCLNALENEYTDE